MTNDELLAWINEMPEWVRKATWLFYQNGAITESNIGDLADLCLGGDNSFKITGINLINHETAQGYAISSIDSVIGVNAIDSNKPLKFKENGITVIYGLNGSGKSGYIRVFKMISGAKYREDIKSNIYSKNKVAPSATISIKTEDDSVKQFVCDLKRPAEHELLRTIDIFDTKISNAYVNDAKEATYEPWVFTLFSELAEIAIKIKNELENRKLKYPIAPYGFQDKYKATNACLKADAVTYKTDLSSFSPSWAPEQEKHLQELRKKNQIEAVKAQLKQIEQQEKNLDLLIKYLSPMADYFSDERWDKLLSAHKEWKEAEKIKLASEILFSENANEIDASSVTLESWKKLWQYAHSYSEDALKKKESISFPYIGSRCPLCRQIITDKTIADRMESIDSYVNGKAVEAERNKYATYERAVKSFPQVKTEEEFSVLLDSAGIYDDEEKGTKLHRELIDFAELTKGDLKTIELKQLSIKDYTDSLGSLRDEVREKYRTTKSLVDDQTQKILEQQILEAEAECYLVSIYNTVKNNIENLGKIREFEQAIKLTATNKITTMSKALAEEMITSDYIRRFESELQELTKGSIAVKLIQQRAGKGKIPYKVVLCDVNGNQISPQDILSEGENRVTSLAAFFAEASGRKEITPLIVDDPISSLDYTYEAKVIDRLVKAASYRQVIVFTHRISMVVGICDKAKYENIEYDEKSLLSSKTRKGVPSDISCIGGKARAQLNTLIGGKLRKLKSMDEFEEGYSLVFHNVCQDFRNIVEKSVEDVLLAEVVKRFRKDIQTKNRIDKLANITVEDCELIDRLMTKYSYYDHSMSDETPLIEITIDELEGDLLELREWIDKKCKQK